jgi:hypothetical protein
MAQKGAGYAPHHHLRISAATAAVQRTNARNPRRNLGGGGCLAGRALIVFAGFSALGKTV